MNRIRAVIVALTLTSTLTPAAAYGQAGPKLTPALTAEQAQAAVVYAYAAYWQHIHTEANNGNRAAVEQLIRWRWAGTGQEDKAVRIAWRESNLRPDVVSYTGCCVGVFQLHTSFHGWRFAARGWQGTPWTDAAANIDAAWHLWSEQGWRPWAQTAG